MAKHPKRPRDFAQLAKLIIDVASGERPNDSPKEPDSPMTQARRKAGQRGGPARARKLSAVKRRLIAKKAARARWSK